MNRRFIRMLITVAAALFMTAFFSLTSAAAGSETVVYLKTGGTGDGSSPDQAVGTLTNAYQTLDLSKDCTVVVCGMFTQTVTWVYGTEYTGSVTFTSVYNDVDYRTSGAVYQFKPARFVCFGETKFENMDFEALGTNLLMVGQHHPITIGEGVTITGAQMTGGSVAKAFTILGGYQKGQSSPPSASDKDTNITVLSGSKLYIVPFSRDILGKYTGTANIKIGGNADVSVLHGSAAYPDGIEVGDVVVEISGDANVRNFYGCTQDTVENSFELTWKSGTIGVFEWVCSYTPKKTMTFNEQTVLKVSNAVKQAANYSQIAAQFDVVSDLETESLNTVYVRDGGAGTGQSQDSPLGSFSSAVAALDGKGGSIIVCGKLSVRTKTTVPEQSGDLTITATNGGYISLSQRLQFAQNTNDNVITLNLPLDVSANYACFMFGGFNNIVFGDRFDVTGSGGSSASLNFYGGVHAGEVDSNEQCTTELPYSIMVKNGVFGRFSGGNLRTNTDQYVGSIAAPISITIDGGTFGAEGTYEDALAPNKSFEAFNVSGMGILADNASLTIRGGTFNTPIYIIGRRGVIIGAGVEKSALTASDRKYYAIDGDVTVNITGGVFKGGAFCAYYVDAGYTQLMRGNYTVTVGAGASFTPGTVFDATQVKSYTGQNQKASITYPSSSELVISRFDIANGAAQSYTDPIRVACIGDSITEGSSVNRLTESYPAQFLKNAQDAGKDIIVANYGISASGIMPSIARYYPDMLAGMLAFEETDADYYVFALGTNDSNSAGASVGAMETFYTGYKAYIQSFGELPNTKKVFVTSVLIRPTESVYSNRAVSVIRPLQKQIAEELAATNSDKYTFVDFYALTFDAAAEGKLLSSDNLHPGKTGYEIMGKVLYDAVYHGICTVSDLEMTDIYLSDSGTPFGAGTADDPISSLTVALGKCAPNATIHILGTFTSPSHVFTPLNREKLTIVGEGNDAVWNLGTAGTEIVVKSGSDLLIDNLTINSTATLLGYYNNIELTDTFKTGAAWQFYAGYNTYASTEFVDPTTTAYFDTEETASSDKDCVITLNGGNFLYVMGGNRRCHAQAPFGIYSGNMVLNIGGHASVSADKYTGIVGMNYLSGTITANINAWNINTLLRDYALPGTVSGVVFNPCMDTGKVAVNIASGVEVNRSINTYGHDLKETEAGIEATCETPGKTAVLVCQRAGCTYTEGGEVVDALDHDMTEREAEVTATCTEPGKTAVLACQRPGCTHTEGGEVIDALDHDLIETAPAEGESCTSPGKTAVLSCQRPGCTYTEGGELVDVLGHDLEEVEAKVPATCTTPGKTAVMACQRANCDHTEGGEVIPASGHSWGDWVETIPAQPGVAGEERRTCTVCEAFETRALSPLPEPEPEGNRNLIALVVGMNKGEYTVRFSTVGASKIEPQTVKKGKTVAEPEAPVKAGFYFAGWYRDARYQEKYDFTEPVRDDLTLYAKWDTVDPRIIMTIGSTDVRVFGMATVSDVPPVIVKDRTMLPARFVLEALGATVSWNASERKVTILYGEKGIELYIDSTTAYMDGTAAELDAAPFIREDRTYLPLRFIAEALGADVSWVAKTKTIVITK